MMATCWLLNEVGAEHAACIIRCVLEVLNSTEDGLTNVWQLDAELVSECQLPKYQLPKCQVPKMSTPKMSTPKMSTF